jgi:hypothetical protein
MALVGACIWVFMVGPVEQVVWRRETKAAAAAA